MKNEKEFFWLEEINCPICGLNQTRKLGIRGNREYFGADTTIDPHIITNVVQCIVCDFIYANPIVRGLDHLEREHYNNPNEYHSTRSSTSPAAMFQKRLSLIAKYKNCGRMLDVGCGKGEFLYEAIKNNYDAVGIEPSQNFCQFAKDYYKVKIYNGFLGQNTEIRKSYFDVIIMSHVIEHIDHHYELFKLASEYLVKDGIIFIEVPNADSYLLRLIDFYSKIKGLNWSGRLSPLHPPYHKYGFTKKSLTYLLRKCNYRIIELKTLSGRDRGYIKKKQAFQIEAFMRDMASILVNLFGNRELICVIATPNSEYL